MRIALEGYAARLAAERIEAEELAQLEALLEEMRQVLEGGDHERLLQLNRQFHTLIYAAAGQQRLYELIANYLDLAEVYRRIFVSLEHARQELVKHEEVLLALRRRDGGLAERLTRAHLQRTAVTLSAFFQSQEKADLPSPEVA